MELKTTEMFLVYLFFHTYSMAYTILTLLHQIKKPEKGFESWNSQW